MFCFKNDSFLVNYFRKIEILVQKFYITLITILKRHLSSHHIWYLLLIFYLLCQIDLKLDQDENLKKMQMVNLPNLHQKMETQIAARPKEERKRNPVLCPFSRGCQRQSFRRAVRSLWTKARLPRQTLPQSGWVAFST